MNTDVAIEVAPVPTAPVPVVDKPLPSPQELFKQAVEYRERLFRNNQDAHRLRIAKRKNLFGPSVEPTHEELVAAVALPEDKIRFIHVATDKYGLPALPKQHGRKKPHMTKRDQAVKSSSIQVFRTLFKNHITKLEAVAKEKGEQFNGVPNDDLPKLGAAAAIAGARIAKARFKAKRVAARKRRKLSRAINFGLIPGNTNVARYIN